MWKVSENKGVKFHIKIPNGCRENGKKTLGVFFFAAPFRPGLHMHMLIRLQDKELRVSNKNETGKCV